MDFVVVGIIITFIVMVTLMVFNKIPTLVALPVMGILFAIVGGVSLANLPAVVEDGLLLLKGAYVPIMIAGIFGDVIKKTGIAENIIRRSVELAGDNTIIVALVCLVVSILCFTGLYGTGALIMVGMIIIPIMISVGVPKIVASGVLLMGCFIGYAFNPAKWAFFVSIFKIGDATESLITLQDVGSFAWKFMIPAVVIAVIFILIGTLKKPKLLSWAAEAPAQMKKDYKRVPLISLLTPVVPVILVLAFKLSQVSLALMIGILYAIITTQFTTRFRGTWNIITGAAYDGFQSTALTVVLMFGVGILVVAAQRPELSLAMSKIITAITPTTVFGFILLFGIIGPVLTQYRGPMNPWGLGAALAKIMAASTLSIPVLLAAFMSFDYIVGVTDATSSQVVWTAGAADTTPVKIQLGTLPFTWLTAFVGVILGIILFPIFK
jgi:H+/gluconate symporter-like permease